MREDDCWLVRKSQGENMFVCAFIDLLLSVSIDSPTREVVMVTYPFKDRQIRNHTTSVEVLESTEDDVIAIIRDLLVIIPRINRTTDEVVILNNQLLRPSLLFVRANDISRPAPEQMVAEKHADGAISFSNFTDNFVSYIPPLPTPAVLLRT